MCYLDNIYIYLRARARHAETGRRDENRRRMLRAIVAPAACRGRLMPTVGAFGSYDWSFPEPRRHDESLQPLKIWSVLHTGRGLAFKPD